MEKNLGGHPLTPDIGSGEDKKGNKPKTYDDLDITYKHAQRIQDESRVSDAEFEAMIQRVKDREMFPRSWSVHRDRGAGQWCSM
jgi:hypothetical protein